MSKPHHEEQREELVARMAQEFADFNDAEIVKEFLAEHAAMLDMHGGCNN